MLDPDQGLVDRAKKGDKVSFGKLVDPYYERVYGLAFGVVKNREAARDVAQDVFLKTYRDLAGFEGKAKFKTWLYRITMNAAIDVARQKKYVTESLDPTDATDEEDKAPVVIEDKTAGPRELASRAEWRELIERGLDELSADHRAVLTLREWQGFSYEEIAEMLGIEIGTVMSRLFYARKKLAKILAVKLGRNA